MHIYMNTNQIDNPNWSMVVYLHQWIGFRENLEENPIIHGNTYGVRFRLCRLNQSIDYTIGLAQGWHWSYCTEASHGVNS